MKNLSDNVKNSTSRNQTLILVEGYDEKNILLNLLLRAFPEINIKMSNIHIFESNVYLLIHLIEKEYGKDLHSCGNTNVSGIM